MTAVAAVSADLSIAPTARSMAAPVPAAAPISALGAATPDKTQPTPFSVKAGAPASASTDIPAAPALQTRTVTFSDAATGILIQADQNSATGAMISQFPDRALIESYAQQLRLSNEVPAAENSLNT